MFHISRHTVSKYIEGDAEKLASPDKIDKINFDTNRNEIIELLKNIPYMKLIQKQSNQDILEKEHSFIKNVKNYLKNVICLD